MEKLELTQHFAKRLYDSMIAAGHSSARSSSGVDIQKLAEISGHSLQICRRYLRGQAIPEPAKLTEIASKLHVSPGWLLFGDDQGDSTASSKSFTIRKNLIHYIFTCAGKLYNTKCSDDEIADFLLDLTNDISKINATEEQSKQIIDLAMSSIKHFKIY